MALGIHEISALQFAKKVHGDFGKVATMGRQGFACAVHEVQEILKTSRTYQGYCEELLVDHFGASIVHSFDVSSFEGATHIQDMSKPLLTEESYDTVIDIGTLEHIFNTAQALDNFSQLTSVGGQIIHCLPANSYCGHGFYQFSPELFFSFYSEENGYTNTRVFIADYRNYRYWYEVTKPANGKRIELSSKSGIGVIVHTTKRHEFADKNVQQSDYLFHWNKENSQATEKVHTVSTANNSLRAFFKRMRPVVEAYRFLRSRYRESFQVDCRPFDKHPMLMKVSIAKLLNLD